MEKEKLEVKVTQIFDKLNIQYKPIEYEDNDLNYYIKVDGAKIIKGMGMLDVLLYFSTEIPKCSLMIGNIYKFEEEVKNRALEIANNINSKLNSGRVIVHSESMQLIFLDSEEEDSFEKIDDKTVTALIDSMYVAIAVIYNETKVYKHEE